MKTLVYWNTPDRAKLRDWVNAQLSVIRDKGAFAATAEFAHDEVKALHTLLEKDVALHILSAQMIDEALRYSETDPYGAPEIHDVQTLLKLIDHLIATAPEYMSKDEKGASLIGFPVNAVLDWCMGTRAGYAFFLNEKVNKCFKDILVRWCAFLDSGDSCYVLNESCNGWFCEDALEALRMDEFVYDKTKAFWGFTSWNDFFTRQFKEGARPVAAPGDPSVIVSACESAPYRIAKNIQKEQKFWLKGQEYSIEYMLNRDVLAKEFIGGTIYQAFLCATKYHRWRSPVDGKIVKAYNVPGTYYSEIRSYPYDPAGPNNSQGYITHTAARAVIFIESGNKDIGLMCFVAVGMSEVSSCMISVKAGESVKKGGELGYFRFGGSTHCLIFQKDVIDEFVLDAIPAEDFNNSSIIKVNSKLATVKKKGGAL
jgi:phosphatidylserine decarboxylase